MATSTEIPRKYLYGLVYLAAALVAEQQEFYQVRDTHEKTAYSRLRLAAASEDPLPNSKRTNRINHLGS